MIKKQNEKLTKIVVKELSTKKILVELLPSKANIAKARNMGAMCDIEVVYVYEKMR